VLEVLRKDLVDAAGIVGTLVAIIAAIAAWRAASIADALSRKRSTSSTDEKTRKDKVRTALVSLLVLDALLLSLDPILFSAFVRVWPLTVLDYGALDVVLTTFQTVTVWMFVTTVVCFAATISAVRKL
jgi:hypothetical protein